MKLTLAIGTLILGLAQGVLAQEVTQFVTKIEFECGGAKVVAKRGQGLIEYQAHVDISRSDRRGGLKLSLGGGDIFGATCMNDAKGAPHVVFQLYRNGSAIDAHWGIIDTMKLQPILLPRSTNAQRVTEILGTSPARGDQWIRIRE